MKFKTALKVILTISLLFLIFQLVDFKYFIDALFRVSPWLLAFVTFCYLLGQVVSTYKWSVFLKAGGIVRSFLTILKAYFIGMFVNCFGLGMVGGDVARGVLVVGESDSRALGVTSVVADRLHGLAVLAAIGLLSALLLQSDFIDTSLISILVAIGLGIISVWFLAPILLPKVIDYLAKRGEANSEKEGQGGVLQKLRASLLMLSNDPKVLLKVTVISVVFHLLQIVIHWFMIQGIGVEVSFYYLLATVPFINILSSLPISWNGVGVREGGYLFFFTHLSPVMHEEQAVVLGAIWLLAVTASSAVGGVVALLSQDFSFSFLKKKMTV